MHELHDKAIRAALAGEWEAAVEFNLEILATQPDHLQTLNRLGRAYTELGQKDAAREIYSRVLAIDKYNPVATRNLKLLPHHNGSSTHTPLAKEDFIELPGITKTATLIKLAARDVLMCLNCKQQLLLTPKAKLIAVTTTDGAYVGCLPDDLSFRLKKLMTLSYTYSICLKSLSDNNATVFLREVSRPKKATASPSFSRVLPIKKLK